MTTAGGYPSLEQRSAEADPLIIEGTGLNEWSRHNDKELSIQRNVLNLNNQHVRITLWSLVYLVIAFMQINANSYMYQFYDDEDLWNQDFAQDQMEYYSLAISSNSIIQFAVIILLCSWFCSCCRMNCNPCVGLLFIVGSIMVFSAMIDGTSKSCKDQNYSNKELLGYCRVVYIGSSIFLATFTFYLAIDVIKSIGDNIRIRLGVKAFLIALRSFLFFAYWNWELSEYSDRSNDGRTYPEVEFLYSTLSGGNMLAGIVCSIIVLLIIIGYGTPYKTLHPCIARLLGYCLLAGIGASLVVFSYGPYIINTQKSFYYAVASVLVVYDLQYL